MASDTIRFIDLFAGVGGFHYGLDSLNRTENRRSKEIEENGSSKRYQESEEVISERGWVGKHSDDGGHKKLFTCVYSNEWDKYANSVYRRHYGQCDNRDIREVDAKEIPDHELLVGGFPCQAFSIAGKRGGFDDTRGTLFFEIARILKEKQPRMLLLENVKGLLSHDNGRTFKTILSTLVELGYDLQWQVLNSKNFGVPQNRERVFIIGHTRGTSKPQVFPFLSSSQGNLKYSGGVISAREQWIKDGNHYSRNFSQGQRIYSTDGISQTLAGQAGGQGGKTGLYETSEMRIRRLTPIETERLQGFPNNWTEFGADGEKVSDTQRYKMMGNAVTTNVITEIIRKMYGV